MIKLFVDMDDVVADWGFAFDVYAAVYDLRTGTEEERKETKRIIMEKHPTFYRDLELIPGALEMWKFFCTYTDPYILSAAATEMLEQSKKDKHYWLKKKFGKLCPPVERIYLVDHPILKQNYCLGPDYVLVDDSEWNISQWNAKGGSGILHTSVADSIAKVKVLFEAYKNVR